MNSLPTDIVYQIMGSLSKETILSLSEEQILGLPEEFQSFYFKEKHIAFFGRVLDDILRFTNNEGLIFFCFCGEILGGDTGHKCR
jgi:hypothetical protein